MVFGAGDYRTRTEDRPPPPELCPGDRLTLGPLEATVVRRLGHSRLLQVRFAGTPDVIWDGIARHGRPIQYAHLPAPLALWDVWTAVAAVPVAFEPPSAGFVLDWSLLDRLRMRGVGFATLTHAAGISSTGDRRARCDAAAGRAISHSREHGESDSVDPCAGRAGRRAGNHGDPCAGARRVA